jgi:hypothetical protein
MMVFRLLYVPRPRQLDVRAQHLHRIEPELHILQAQETVDEQPRPHQQHHGERRFEHQEDTLAALAGAGGLPVSFLQGTVQVGP